MTVSDTGNQERVKTKPSYDQAEKLPRECQTNDSQEKHQPGINTQVVVESYVVLWISVEVTTAEQVDQVAQHPQQRWQPTQQQMLQTNNIHDHDAMIS